MSSQTPLPDLAGVQQPWVRAANTNASIRGSEPWTYFSATCWFFARTLYDNLKVPLGMMVSDW